MKVRQAWMGKGWFQMQEQRVQLQSSWNNLLNGVYFFLFTFLFCLKNCFLSLFFFLSKVRVETLVCELWAELESRRVKLFTSFVKSSLVSVQEKFSFLFVLVCFFAKGFFCLFAKKVRIF